MSLSSLEKKIEEIHRIVIEMHRKNNRAKQVRLTIEQVSERSGLALNTIRAYTTRGRIKSRQTQPGAKRSKRYYVEDEVFDDEGNLIFH